MTNTPEQPTDGLREIADRRDRFWKVIKSLPEYVAGLVIRYANSSGEAPREVATLVGLMRQYNRHENMSEADLADASRAAGFAEAMVRLMGHRAPTEPANTLRGSILRTMLESHEQCTGIDIRHIDSAVARDRVPASAGIALDELGRMRDEGLLYPAQWGTGYCVEPTPLGLVMAKASRQELPCPNCERTHRVYLEPRLVSLLLDEPPIDVSMAPGEKLVHCRCGNVFRVRALEVTTV